MDVIVLTVEILSGRDARDKAVCATIERDSNAFFRGKTEGALSEGLATKRKGCHCKKSECMKKYCECFQAGLSCTEECKCLECKNGKLSSPDVWDFTKKLKSKRQSIHSRQRSRLLPRKKLAKPLLVKVQLDDEDSTQPIGPPLKRPKRSLSPDLANAANQFGNPPNQATSEVAAPLSPPETPERSSLHTDQFRYSNYIQMLSRPADLPDLIPSCSSGISAHLSTTRSNRSRSTASSMILNLPESPELRYSSNSIYGLGRPYPGGGTGAGMVGNALGRDYLPFVGNGGFSSCTYGLNPSPPAVFPSLQRQSEPAISDSIRV